MSRIHAHKGAIESGANNLMAIPEEWLQADIVNSMIERGTGCLFFVDSVLLACYF